MKFSIEKFKYNAILINMLTYSKVMKLSTHTKKKKKSIMQKCGLNEIVSNVLQGIIDRDRFIQLETMTNPDFVNIVIEAYFKDSPKAINDIENAL